MTLCVTQPTAIQIKQNQKKNIYIINENNDTHLIKTFLLVY